MAKKVNWIVLEEEFTVGFAGDVFITEECVRFDPPRVMIHEDLYAAMEWVLDYDDNEADEDERQRFSNQLINARKAYVEAKKKTIISQFVKKMDEKFSAYKKDGIMASYKCNREKCEMWLSKEDNTIDHGYLWSALDGALLLWNEQCGPYTVYVEEYDADANGMIKYEFSCEC